MKKMLVVLAVLALVAMSSLAMAGSAAGSPNTVNVSLTVATYAVITAEQTITLVANDANLPTAASATGAVNCVTNTPGTLSFVPTQTGGPAMTLVVSGATTGLISAPGLSQNIGYFVTGQASNNGYIMPSSAYAWTVVWTFNV